MAFARRVSRCAADPFRIRATRAARSGGERKPARIMFQDESISNSSAIDFFAVSMSRGIPSCPVCPKIQDEVLNLPHRLKEDGRRNSRSWLEVRKDHVGRREIMPRRRLPSGPDFGGQRARESQNRRFAPALAVL